MPRLDEPYGRVEVRPGAGRPTAAPNLFDWSTRLGFSEKTGVAVIALVGAVAARAALQPWAEDGYTFATFYCAALVVALMAGAWFGAAAASVSAVLALQQAGPSDDVGAFIVWTATVGPVVAIGAIIRDSLKRAREARVSGPDAGIERSALIDDLTHRQSNAFALLLALFEQTARQAASIDEIAARFPPRLQALALSKKLMLERLNRPVALNTLLAATLSRFIDFHSGQIRLASSDNIFVEAGQCTGLVLALHELATNAERYGALSTPAGRVVCACQEADGCAQVEWLEASGPRVSPPAREGVGLFLIRNMLSHPDARLDFSPAGVRCIIRLQSNAQAQA